jgi:hypothetical protein
MRQTITERFGKRFYELFEKNLNDYECWHGFDSEKFKKDFVPTTLLQSEKFRLLDYITASVGYEAAKLIEAILNYGTVTFSLNGELEGIQDGQSRNFFIVLPNKEIENRKGEIYFPFAIHEEENCKWTVTHLPTGYSIVKNLNREVASDLLIALCANFADELYTSEYRSETVGKLYDFIMKRLR